LTLGLDRDSELLLALFDERNEAVTRAMGDLIETAHNLKPKVKVGICGQSPSDFLSIRLFLVKEGIDSISLNPDTVVRARMDIAKLEKMTRKEQEQAFKEAIERNE
jgi:pyruvate,water dikinase